MLLEGSSALITGASSGIGKACAIRLAHDGAAVCINYFSAHERGDADAVVATITAAGGKAFAAQADVGDEAGVAALVTEVIARFGTINVLVNNAGIEKQIATLDMSVDDWNRVLRTNLTGSFLCLREAGRHMSKHGGGVIINMSSVHEFIPWPGFAHYCASKGALKLLMQTVAREWAPLGIRVVNVAPGAIATPINDFVLDDPKEKALVESEIPLGRFGQPEEIAAVVAWAASSEASYVTGTTLVADGGMSTYPRFV